MERNRIKRLSSLSLVLLLFSMSHWSWGQEKEPDLKKEVEVVKPYEPSVSGAYKINEIPQIRHQDTEKPIFDYQIKSTPVFTKFHVEAVQPARMVDEPGPEQRLGLLRLGVGNYNSPYGEVFLNAGSGRTTFGTHFKHLSSHGKVRLRNSDQVKAPASDNQAELFVNHFFRDSISLKGNLFFNRKGFRYYGYPGPEVDDKTKQQPMPFWNKKQAVSAGGFDLKLDGSNRQGDRYEAGLAYQYYTSATGQKGSLARVGGQLKKDFELFEGKLDAYLNIEGTDSVYSENSEVFTERGKVVLEVHPAVTFGTDLAALTLGINSYTTLDADKVENVMLTPNIKASFSPVKNWITLFGGVDGYLQQNHYLAVFDENPYVNPYHNVKNAKYRYILTGGFRGRMTNNLNYRFQADYSSIRNHHFYILKNRYTRNDIPEDVLITRTNTFDVVYDHVKQLSVGGEIHYAASGMMDFLLKGTYHSYDTQSQAEAWQLPGMEASAHVQFKPDGPFTFTADIFYVGERKALIAAELFNEQTNGFDPYPGRTYSWNMDMFLDLNFSIEYEFTEQLSFWTRVNNFSAQKYDRWQGYTGKGVNFLLGLSYSF